MAFSQEQLITLLYSSKDGSFGRLFPHFSLHVFDQVASTNQTVWELLEAGNGSGTTVIALQQTAGRGQWGRHWQSCGGGLYLSLGLLTEIPIVNSAELTLWAAWGLAQCLRDYGVPVQIKWPNDLVLAGRKLGGILTETRVPQGQIVKAVVGVGINWANQVPETGITLKDFCQDKNPADVTISSLEMLAGVVLGGLASGYQFWQEKGIAELLPAYEELLSHLGDQVEVAGRQGVVVGVSPRGELRVALDSDTGPSEIELLPGTISLGYNY